MVKGFLEFDRVAQSSIEVIVMMATILILSAFIGKDSIGETGIVTGILIGGSHL